MKEELDLPCLYNVILDTVTSTYSFTTDNHIEYKIIFIDCTSFFSGSSTAFEISKVYNINIDKTSYAKAPLDLNVKNTVDSIITHFFRDKENSLIYVCDTSDLKHEARQRKFGKWYQDSKQKIEFIKLDEVIKTEDAIHYTSLIYHTENPFRSSLETGFYEIVETLNKPSS